MTPQEKQLLQQFLDQLVQVQGIGKDPEADAMIRAATARQPEAAYLLVQRSLLLNQAVDSAKEQIARLEAELRTERARGAARPSSGGSFLDPASAWGNSAGTATAVQPASAASVSGRPLAPAVMPAAMGPAGGFGRSGFLGGGMLGTMAATAAGVAGGAFLFQGISQLLNPNQPDQASDSQADSGQAGADSGQGQSFDSASAGTESGLEPGAFDDPGLDDPLAGFDSGDSGMDSI